MFKKYNWQQPIYKNDLRTVLIFGISAMILGGILSGLLEALLYDLNIRISFSLLLNAVFIGFLVKKAYASYHILYPTLALVFYFFSFFFSDLGRNVGILGLQNLGYIFTSPQTYYYFIIIPFRNLIYMINYGFDFVLLLFLLLNIFFYILGFVSVYKLSKGRN